MPADDSDPLMSDDPLGAPEVPDAEAGGPEREPVPESNATEPETPSSEPSDGAVEMASTVPSAETSAPERIPDAEPRAASPGAPAGETWFRSARSRVARLFVVALLNLPLTFLVGLLFLSQLHEGAGLESWLSALVAWLSTATSFNVIVALLLLPLILAVRGAWTTTYVAPGGFALLNLLVLADYYLLKNVGMHFSATSLQLMTTPGVEDSTTLGWGTFITATLVVVAVAGLTVGAILGLRWLWTRLFARHARRATIAAGLALLGVVVLDKGIYAWADVADYVPYTRVHGMFPLYQPVTMKRALKNWGVAVHTDNPSMRQRSSSLRLPRAPITFAPGAPKPNVIMVAIEGMRYDMLTPEIMPNLHAWSKDRLVAVNHHSGGNASRYGIFCMLYGIYGTYWMSALHDRHPPPMLESMAERGYAFSILSCTDLNFPEFRRTAFVHLADRISDTWTCERVERDDLMTGLLLKFLDERDEAKPFFSFLFYDAPHQPYLFPKKHEIFTVPENSDEINYILDVGEKNMLVRRLRYQNSLHYIDELLQRIFDDLKRRGLEENTIVIIAGDHGEEFGELGYLGHNNSFDRYQTHTIMVASLPGQGARRLTRLSSHLDFVPTIMQAMGATNPISDYSQGVPLTDDQPQPFTVATSYSTAAIIELDGVTEFGTETHRAGFTLRDIDYKIIAEGGAAVRLKRPLIMKMIAGRRHFIK
jgi:membrane-anchored protein YejM (alkaline phosphatase superfamily)